MVRKILSIGSGLSVGILIILLLRVWITAYFPFPGEELTWLDRADMNKYISSLPNSAFVLIAISHVLGAFLASLISSLVAKKSRFTMGIIAGSVIFVVVFVFNFWYDFPRGYLMVDTFVTAIAAFAGSVFGKGRTV